MATARIVRKSSSTDAVYIAGIIDGEGSISLTRRHRNENRQLEVSISNSDMVLLHYLKEAVGAGRISSKRTYRHNHRARATYSISNRQALSLLEQIKPYIRTYKAERAELVLGDYVKLTPRNGFYTPELARSRAKFEDKFLCTKPGHNRRCMGSSSAPSALPSEVSRSLSSSLDVSTMGQ